MKPHFFLLFLLVTVCNISCNKRNLDPSTDKKEEVVDIKLLNDLCLDVENELTPTKDVEFINEAAFIKYDSYYKLYYLQIKGYEETKFDCCKLPEELKHDNTKILISGAAYVTRCKPLHPCSGRVTHPFLILNIKQL
ncbi:hypothetical protein [Emticicia sp. 21SJ11W-3]|uniref:hypothetical protein n=1 Tax=Emticicia sp. 21SJ11W-3 TaxID=2916755 RepID=UPI0020A0AD3E|nr:hypothetical protein [Emticicia sp. 21SJ11W-3]UTA68461.1 hypothetical protein MB380_01330 [Emticicia sp. 21SJ11W-3]